MADGELLAISDRGFFLRFAPPGSAPQPVRIANLVEDGAKLKANRDAEAATRDPASGRIWVAWENRNAISRFSPGLREEARARPPAMRHWAVNQGPEALARLRDGRFLVLSEGFSGLLENRRHAALLFPGDPTLPGESASFTLSGPEGFSPTDVAQLPDGRVLVLMRRLVWPFLARFEGLIAIADPGEIRPGSIWMARGVAWLAPPVPVDNFEGMALEERQNGKLGLWLISDDNSAAAQRTLLLRLAVDPAALPGARKKARESLARPVAAQR